MHLEKTLDSNYFCGKIHFEDDETQNYLVFQPLLSNNANSNNISIRKPFFDKVIKPHGA